MIVGALRGIDVGGPQPRLPDVDSFQNQGMEKLGIQGQGLTRSSETTAGPAELMSSLQELENVTEWKLRVQCEMDEAPKLFKTRFEADDGSRSNDGSKLNGGSKNRNQVRHDDSIR